MNPPVATATRDLNFEAAAVAEDQPTPPALRRPTLRSVGPALVVLLAAVALWLATGVSPGQIALFLAYHVLFVIAPGWLVYRLLRPSDTHRLRQLVMGWALGYVLEVLAFAGTAAIHARGALVGYPVVILLIAATQWRRRVATGAGSKPASGAEVHVASTDGRPALALPQAWPWAVAALCVLALAFLGVEYFGTAPLPEHVDRVSYGVDTVWYLSLAGEALHHWPVSDPTVSGQPLYYHLFSSFDPASIVQVTGLNLPLVFFRLYMVPMVVLAVLGLCLAGASFGGAWSGPIAAVVALFVGELNLDPHVGYRFANELGDDIVAISPSFLLGTALFMPLLTVLGELQRFSRRRSEPSTQPASALPRGALAVFALLVIGAIGAKAPIPIVLAGGLCLYLLWHARTQREIHRPLLAALAVTVIASIGFWLISYNAAGSDQLSLNPPGVIRQMDAISYIAAQLHLHGHAVPLMWLAMAAIGITGAYGAQLTGVFAGPSRSARGGWVLLLALFMFGQLPYLLYTHPGLSQVFFSEYGVLAACLVSAEGLRRMWTRTESRSRLVGFAVVCFAIALLVAYALPLVLGLQRGDRRAVYMYVDFGLAIALACSYLFALSRRKRALGRYLPFVAAAALAVGVSGRLLTVAVPTASRIAADRPLYSQTGPGMTRGLYRALLWIRTHTKPSAVIAVNNFRDWTLYWSRGWASPDDFYYSAFAERRVFLEGWIYTQLASQTPVSFDDGRHLLFRDRIELNNAIFQWAHAGALREAARRYGVRYLLVDRVHNAANPRLGMIARLVYANHDAAVYAVPSPRLQPHV